MRSGWLRLWVVITALLVTGTGVLLALDIWERPVCYEIKSVSIRDSGDPDRVELARSIRSEVVSRQTCGTQQTSNLLTLERLAKEDVVYQMSISWLEPSGWSFDSARIDVFDGGEITAQAIPARAEDNVQKARMRESVAPFLSVIGFCLFLLLLGYAVKWVRDGFRS